MNLRLSSGEPVIAKRFEGNVLTLHSPKAFAPGSPISFDTGDDEPKRAFEGRTIGSKRIDNGTFEVRLRLVNLWREHRLFLEQRLAR
jgi:hypothetical protein